MSHTPKPHESRCFCSDGTGSFDLHTALSPHKVVAYLRADTEEGIEGQRQRVDEYCRLHHMKKVAEHAEVSAIPAKEFDKALSELYQADSLIVADLERLVTDHRDRAHELRPLLHRFMCEGGKHLVAVAEGIDTRTAAGQRAAIEFINQLKDSDARGTWFS